MTKIYINPREAENLFHMVSNTLANASTELSDSHRALLKGLASKFAATGTTSLDLNNTGEGYAREELKELVATAKTEQEFVLYLGILNKWREESQ